MGRKTTQISNEKKVHFTGYRNEQIQKYRMDEHKTTRIQNG